MKKYQAILISSLMLVPSVCKPLQLPPQSQQRQSLVLKQILKNNPKINKQYAEKLSRVIIEKSKKYRIPAGVFAAILMQESSYKLEAKHTHCGYASIDSELETCVVTDFGISQIHHLNLGRFNLDKKKLVTDLDYSVDAGAMVLASYLRFQKREPKTWFCRYNKGIRSFDEIKDDCLFYKSKVDRYL